jgi:DNA recombination protein RmuC
MIISLEPVFAASMAALVCAILVYLFRAKTNDVQKLSELTQNLSNLEALLRENRVLYEQHKQSLISELQLKFQAQFMQATKELHTEQMKALQFLQERLHDGMNQTRRQVTEVLQTHNQHLTQSVEKLTTVVEKRLQDISNKVEQRLSEGFEKTTMTFTDIIKRLALIDEAQKKITELSTNVVNLQSILDDKRTRGAFGEVQLNNLIRNMIPDKHFSFQHTLSNNRRVDCILLLPEPTGNIAIDAKFPLETFRKLHESNTDNKPLQQQFRQDIKKHVQDIAQRYIVPPETADGAMMFIPAEAVFAEIHAGYPDLIEFAQRKRVWLVSPTTLMAVLTTARAVLKDAATRKQVHIIRDHLVKLATDFTRFEKRMDSLSKHIQQANDDVSEVNTSAKKLSSRFRKIERVELEEVPLID